MNQSIYLHHVSNALCEPVLSIDGHGGGWFSAVACCRSEIADRNLVSLPHRPFTPPPRRDSNVMPSAAAPSPARPKPHQVRQSGGLPVEVSVTAVALVHDLQVAQQSVTVALLTAAVLTRSSVPANRSWM